MSPRREEIRLEIHDTVITAMLTRSVPISGPLIVALHGASYDMRYFDAPGCSVHERAHAAGLSMISITRPGYPATHGSASSQESFERVSATLDSVIGEVWRMLGPGHAGVVLIGHSVGAAIALHVASRRPRWPLLGVAVSGVGDIPAKGPASVFASTPRHLCLEMPFEQVRHFFYSSESSDESTTFDSLAGLLVPFPASDVVEVNTTWCDQLPLVAEKVDVPVHYTLAEWDSLWEVDDERVSAFCSYFTNSPRTWGSVCHGVGHNIEHHAAGYGYVTSVLEFARKLSVTETW